MTADCFLTGAGESSQLAGRPLERGRRHRRGRVRGVARANRHGRARRAGLWSARGGPDRHAPQGEVDRLLHRPRSGFAPADAQNRHPCRHTDGVKTDRRGPLSSMTEPIHITIPGAPDDPRSGIAPPSGVRIHGVPALHPDDVVMVDGLPVTSVARTLIDCAEDSSRDELRAMFRRAFEPGFST